MTESSRAKVQPILPDDIATVARYLQDRMNSNVPVVSWEAAMRASWQHDPPNHGFLLRADNGTVVGAYLALYSTRTIRDEAHRICNLAAWCVDESFRFQSVRLLKALLGQEGYDFVDLSPSGNVVALNRRLGFHDLDTQTAVAANLPALRTRGAVRLTSEPATIEASLTGSRLQIYRDHATSPAVRHVLVTTPSGSAHVMYRRDRRKHLPIFANIVYVSDRQVLREALPRLQAHLLRRGLPVLLAELRTTGCRPKWAWTLKSPRPKMFKSAELGAEDIDDLYSELVALAW